MVKMIWQQFNYSKKQWTASLFLFMITGLLTGICLNGIYTLKDHYPQLVSAHNSPILIFIYPMIFGIITLFIVSSGVIKLIIYNSGREYTLWTILGANSTQLSFLISGQVALISLIGSAIGFVGAFPFTSILYKWVRQLFGTTQYIVMPPLPSEFSLPAFWWTIIFISLTAGLAGYFHSHKLFSALKNDVFDFQKVNTKLQAVFKGFVIIFISISLLATYINATQVSSWNRHLIRIGQSSEAIKSYVSNVMIIMFLTIVLFTLLSPLILSPIIKLWTKILPKKKFATTNTAFWTSIFDQHYLTSLIAPLFGASFLLTGLTIITSHFTAGGPNREAATNTLLSLVIILGAPLIIIFTNVLVITVIVSKQQSVSLKQFNLLGFSSSHLIMEKLMESLIYGFTLLICGIVGNLPLYLLVQKIGFNLHHPMNVSLSTITYWPTISFLIILIFIITVDVARIIKVQSSNNMS